MGLTRDEKMIELAQANERQDIRMKKLEQKIIDLIAAKTVLKDIRDNLKSALTISAFIAIFAGFVVTSFDYISFYLHGTGISYQFAPGLGFNQKVVACACLVIGLVFLRLGKK